MVSMQDSIFILKVDINIRTILEQSTTITDIFDSVILFHAENSIYDTNIADTYSKYSFL